MVLVLAADHQNPDLKAFSNAGISCTRRCRSRPPCNIWYKSPLNPQPGMGTYYRENKISEGGCFKLTKFVEKPDLATAEQYQREGYLWNSGNFLFKAQTFIDELRHLAPEILEAVSEAHSNAKTDLDFLRLEKTAFERSPSISVDYAVMEQTEKAAVFPVDYSWSDVGSWEAVWEVSEKSADGNVIIGDAEIVKGANNLVHSVGKLTTLVGINDIAVVTTRDAVLVTSKSEAENVKELVINLQKNGRVEANEALQIFRPWGNYERLDIGEKYQVKRIIISPGGVLSLQKHRHRAEHWVVVSGNPEVTID